MAWRYKTRGSDAISYPYSICTRLNLSLSPFDAPLWTMRRTPGQFIFVVATWFLAPFANISPRQVARGVAFGLLGVIWQIGITGLLVWCCITVSAYIFDSTFLQVVSTVILLVVGARLVLPLFNLITMPLMMVIALPLDLLFPLKKKVNVREIKWCRNCRHYKKSKEYEDMPPKGLWFSGSMPRRDELPCNIALEAAKVWEDYFKVEPSSRALFPKDCPFFEKRA